MSPIQKNKKHIIIQIYQNKSKALCLSVNCCSCRCLYCSLQIETDLEPIFFFFFKKVEVCAFKLFLNLSDNRDKAPGQRECDYSIDSINKCIRDIEQASLAAVGQTLPCRDDISMEVSWSALLVLLLV